MWTIFGSTLCFGNKNPEHPNATFGNSCQRNGVMYRWVFNGDTGGFLCIVTVDGINVSRPPIRRIR